MGELINVKLHHKICSDLCRFLNEGEGCTFELDSNGLVLRTATAYFQIVIFHSFKRLNYNPVLAGHPGE